MARIAFLKSSSTGKGGLEKYTRCLTEAFHERGHDVFLLTTEWGGKTAGNPFEVVDFGRSSKSSFLHLLQFDKAAYRWFSDNHVDAVFGLDRNFYPQDFYRAGNGVHKAFLDHRKNFSSFLKRITLQINPLHWLILRMEKETYLNPDLRCLFTNSELVRREILEYYPTVNRDKIKVVLNGVEWEKLEKPFEESLEKRAEIQQSLGLTPGVFQFLFVGHEYKRKGLLVLLQALALLKDRPFQLSVVGKERDLKGFKEAACNLGLDEKKVLFFGVQKDVVPFYQAADCCVIPSYYDPFANVTVEALAMGLFVVSSVMNGGAEVISSDKMGCVFREFRPEAVARTLDKAMSMPKTENSARFIRQHVSHLDFSNQIQTLVRTVEESL